MLSGESSLSSVSMAHGQLMCTPGRTSKRAETVGRGDLQWGVKSARSAGADEDGWVIVDEM